MPVYAYRALNKKAKTVRGVLDADSPGLARAKLRSDGLFPVEVRPASAPRVRSAWLDGLKKAGFKRRKHVKDLTPFTRQLATLLAAGLPLVQALDTIQEQADDQSFRQILALVKDEVTSGEALAEVMADHKDLFPDDYVHLVRAGEVSGSLEPVLERLADSLEQRQARRAKVVSALTYPVFMIFIGTVVIIFLLSVIIPTMTGLFDELGAALPWPTRVLLAVSGFIRDFWWLLALILIGLIVLAVRLLRSEDRYRRIESLAFRLPVVGPLFQKLLVAQAFRSLALMLAGGVPLTAALEVAAKGLGRSNFGLALNTAAQKIHQGRSLTEGLGEGRLFPPLARRMIAVGESGGALEEMMARVATAYEEETERVMAALTSLVEPVIIVAMGAIVGFMVLAVLLPIFNLSGLIG